MLNTNNNTLHNTPSFNGYYGAYGGAYVPEVMMPALEELTDSYEKIKHNVSFQDELADLLKNYVGRPTPLTHAKRLGSLMGLNKLYLKREDLTHTGAHKINNALAQALLAKYMGKKSIIAETGAGQHGVATATACALLNLECTIYMGAKDIERQQLNVFRMELLGARVISVKNGSQTLKDAISEALRHWVTNITTTHYLLGSVVGPHPYPYIVREFQSVIGTEAKKQILEVEGKVPDYLIACVGGGSNSIGLFHPSINEANVRFVGVEAAGQGVKSGNHAVRLSDDSNASKLGVFQGTKSYLLQDQFGNIAETHSIAPGLDYVSIGPEHALLKDTGRARYISVDDSEVLQALRMLCQTEGIIPALESAHAVAGLIKIAAELNSDDVVILNISGRGDKDLSTVIKHFPHLTVTDILRNN